MSLLEAAVGERVVRPACKDYSEVSVARESSIMRMFTTTMMMTVMKITWLKQDCCHC